MATINEKLQEQFQVSWRHVNYTIDQKASLSRRLQERISTTCKFAAKFWNDTSRKASYDVKQAEEGLRETRILQNLNGSFRSGELTALMGPSGAGKTSLLKYLSGSQSTSFSGNLTVAHHSGQRRRIIISAISHNDHLPGYLSVRENLTFACKLKNPSDGHEDREKNVQRVSNLLGLDDCLDTRTSRISGGQQKRLAIAQELLSRPDILILDEPTSGLDSQTCLTTLSVLKDLVRASAKGLIEPIAVVLTIHQPPKEALALFDKLYVMALGGLAIYDGPPDGCQEFVEKYSGGLQVPDGYNPASFLIDIASGEFGQRPIDLLTKQVELEHYWRRPKGPASGSAFSLKLTQQGPSSRGSWWRKTYTLLERCCICTIREPRLSLLRILYHLLIPFVMYIMMGRQAGQANTCPKFSHEYNLQKLIHSDEYTSEEPQRELLMLYENAGMFYSLIQNCVCANIVYTILIFSLDMRSSLREIQNGWYSMNNYIPATLLANLPMDVILPSITVALTYWLTGQQHSPTASSTGLSGFYRVMIISSAMVICTLIGGLVGMVFGAIYLHQLSTALFVAMSSTLPLILLSGFLVRTKDMSTFARVLSMASPYRHYLVATFIARYGFNVCGCSGEARPLMANVTMTGVPPALKSFADYWLAQEQQHQQVDQPTDSTNFRQAADNDDIFQLAAKQLSEYNTYGMQIESCKDVKPFVLHDFGTSDDDLLGTFVALLALLAGSTLMLLFTVKLTVGRRTSLTE